MVSSGLLNQAELTRQIMESSGFAYQMAAIVENITSSQLNNEAFRSVIQSLANWSPPAGFLDSVALSIRNIQRMEELSMGVSFSIQASYAEMLASFVGLSGAIARSGDLFIVTTGDIADPVVYQERIELPVVESSESDTDITEETVTAVLLDALSSPHSVQEHTGLWEVRGTTNWDVLYAGEVISSTSLSMDLKTTDRGAISSLRSFGHSLVQHFSVWNDPQAQTLSVYLNKHFSITELDALCRRIGIEPEEVPGTTRSEKANEIVAYYFRRNGAFGGLIAVVQEERPLIPLPDDLA